ncbi:MAG: S24 family peptidase [Lentimicrobiaceae bacterium]|nr:S24 family peptidase [Lentimicrobiaceae bacterium]
MKKYVSKGIDEGDILVIDKSVEPYNNCLAFCSIDGEFTLKRLLIMKDNVIIVLANKGYQSIRIVENNHFISLIINHLIH